MALNTVISMVRQNQIKWPLLSKYQTTVYIFDALCCTVISANRLHYFTTSHILIPFSHIIFPSNDILFLFDDILSGAKAATSQLTTAQEVNKAPSCPSTFPSESPRPFRFQIVDEGELVLLMEISAISWWFMPFFLMLTQSSSHNSKRATLFSSYFTKS